MVAVLLMMVPVQTVRGNLVDLVTIDILALVVLIKMVTAVLVTR